MSPTAQKVMTNTSERNQNAYPGSPSYQRYQEAVLERDDSYYGNKAKSTVIYTSGHAPGLNIFNLNSIRLTYSLVVKSICIFLTDELKLDEKIMQIVTEIAETLFVLFYLLFASVLTGFKQKFHAVMRARSLLGGEKFQNSPSLLSKFSIFQLHNITLLKLHNQRITLLHFAPKITVN